MPLREQHNYDELWKKTQQLVTDGKAQSMQDVAFALKVNRTTLDDAFRRKFGRDAVRDLFNQAKVKEEADKESTEAEYGKDFINIVCASKRITTVDEAIRYFKVNMDE